MSLVLTWGARIPTLRIARMAGQFAKPRSKEMEVVNGVEMLAFRGDNVNSFDTSARTPDPTRLVDGYFHSAATLNYARAVLASGLADLNAASHWDLGFVQDETHRRQYNEMVDRILSALDFMRVCGVADEAALKTAAVYMSHEGLQLCYEEALTRPSINLNSNTSRNSRVGSVTVNTSATVPSSSSTSITTSTSAINTSTETTTTPVHPPAAHANTYQSHAHQISSPSSLHSLSLTTPTNPNTRWYNLGTHFLWIGDRTRQIDHAHIEYFRGIQNPVGIKAGPTSDPNEIVAIIHRLWPNPRALPGKIVIITRMGANNVRSKLPALITAIYNAGFTSPVVWTCDPMHGNTRVSSNNYKTRDFDDILAELKHTFEIHREMGSRLGGVHFELTGENVTECTGGPEKILESDLPHRYTTYCDPRLNYAQGMELAFLIAQYLADEREQDLIQATGLTPDLFIDGGSDIFRKFDPTSPNGRSHYLLNQRNNSNNNISNNNDNNTLNNGIKRENSRVKFAAGRGLSPVLQTTIISPTNNNSIPELGLDIGTKV